MIRILGIDPGSRLAGYGIIISDGMRNHYVASGSIRVSGEDLAQRLGIIFRELTQIIEAHRPDVMAVEKVFVHRNAGSALKLGQARGAAICAGITRALPLFEYTPREIKQAVVGKGGAAKEQVQHMVRVLLNLGAAPQQDASDALAVALCHGHTQVTKERVLRASGGKLR